VTAVLGAAPLAHRLVGAGIEASIAGGKGAALDRLVALGAPVPPVGVVTTASYRPFAAEPAIAALLDELRTSPVPAPSEHAAQRQRIDEVFLSVPLPMAVREALDVLVDDIAGVQQVAVRSSATAEDLGAASFAGQYESYLDVERGDVHEAVRRVWASLWYPSPRAYRRFRAIDDTEVAMAVVIMRMVRATRAGVLFTVDPGGRPNAVRLEVVEGLGEQLVSGAVTPEAHVVDRDDLPASFAAIAPPLADLAREALRLEEALGAPQDIEFAIEDQDLYLVQARPITTTTEIGTDDGFDVSCGPRTTYTTAGIAETLRGVLPPLSWSINSHLVENGFRSLFDLLGGGVDALTHDLELIGRFRGRAALNLDAMRLAAEAVPGGSPEELEQQYFGAAQPSQEVNREADQALQRAGASRVRQGMRVLRARRRAAEDAEVAVQAVARVVAREPDLTALDDAALLAYWSRMLHLAQQVVAAEIAVAAIASASYRSVEVFLSRYLDAAEASQAARELTATDAAQRRARVALAVEPVVARLSRDPELRAAAVEDWDDARSRLERSPGGGELVDAMLSAWRRAGSTGIFAGQTWEEVPQLTWKVVYQALVRPTEATATNERAERRLALERRLASDPKWRGARSLTGQIVDVRRRFLRREASDAAEFLDRRELTKAAVLQLGGVMRRCHLELGRRLVARGRLEAADDVEMLAPDELRMLVGDPGPTLEVIARRRRYNQEAEQAPALPQVWTGTPPAVAVDAASGERFEGWSASPGRYEGLARVVRSPGSTEFRRGEVLVATTTDASWSPLFLAAGAIVVEQGGPLSHAAIVARELGLPTVVNVPGLIARLEAVGGTAHVVVDGTAGVVTIQDAEPIAPAGGGDGTDEAIDLTDGPTDGPTAGPTDGPTDGAAPAAYVPGRIPDRRWDDTSMRMGVFVAGLIGAGALLSAIVGLTESISSVQGRDRLRRRAVPIALTMADGAVDGYGVVAVSATGLRPRRWYAMAAVVLAVLGGVITARATDGYVDDGSALEWALTSSGAVALFAVAAVGAVAALRWPAVPAVVRRLAPARPVNERSFWRSVPRAGQIAIAVMASAVAVGAVLVTFAEDWVLRLDRRAYFDWIGVKPDFDRWTPDWFNTFGKPLPTIAIAVAVSLVTLTRCRVVALAYPLAIVTAGITRISLGWLTHRSRPPLSDNFGDHDSFPGGHTLQQALLFLILPLVAYVLTNRTWIRVVATVVSVAVWAVSWTDVVRSGGHWPVDQAAGLLIAVSLLIVVYSVGLDTVRHESCHGSRAPSSP
jgi:pyruvate,water dikinase